MKIVVTKNLVDELEGTSQECNANEQKLVRAIANIPTEKFEELVQNVVTVASKHNKTFETDREELRYGVQVAPERVKDGLLNIYGAGSLYAFEVSVVANKVKFSLFANVLGNAIERTVESEEMQQLLENFLSENIVNYSELLQQEKGKTNKNADKGIER